MACSYLKIGHDTPVPGLNVKYREAVAGSGAPLRRPLRAAQAAYDFTANPAGALYRLEYGTGNEFAWNRGDGADQADCTLAILNIVVGHNLYPLNHIAGMNVRPSSEPSTIYAH